MVYPGFGIISRETPGLLAFPNDILNLIAIELN